NLVTSFLKEFLHQGLYDDFELEYALYKRIVMENDYQGAIPDVYLSTFDPCLSEHKNHPIMSPLIDNGLEEFVQSNICLYSNYHEHTCHFVGSIAYHFKEELIKVCVRHQIKVGKIIKQPILDLYRYIMEREKLQNSI